MAEAAAAVEAAAAATEAAREAEAAAGAAAAAAELPADLVEAAVEAAAAVEAVAAAEDAATAATAAAAAAVASGDADAITAAVEVAAAATGAARAAEAAAGAAAAAAELPAELAEAAAEAAAAVEAAAAATEAARAAEEAAAEAAEETEAVILVDYKQETGNHRRRQREQDSLKLWYHCLDGSQYPEEEYPVPPLFSECVRATLRLLTEESVGGHEGGIPQVSCAGEADFWMALESSKTGAIVHGNDSDFLMFGGCRYVPFGGLHFDVDVDVDVHVGVGVGVGGVDRSTEGVGGVEGVGSAAGAAGAGGAEAVMLTREGLAEELGVPELLLVEWSILLGNDYTGEGFAKDLFADGLVNVMALSDAVCNDATRFVDEYGYPGDLSTFGRDACAWDAWREAEMAAGRNEAKTLARYVHTHNLYLFLNGNGSRNDEWKHTTMTVDQK